MSLGVIEWSRVELDQHVTARGSTCDAPRGRRSYELTSPLTTYKTRGYDYLNAIPVQPRIVPQFHCSLVGVCASGTLKTMQSAHTATSAKTVSLPPEFKEKWYHSKGIHP